MNNRIVLLAVTFLNFLEVTLFFQILEIVYVCRRAKRKDARSNPVFLPKMKEEQFRTK